MYYLLSKISLALSFSLFCTLSFANTMITFGLYGSDKPSDMVRQFKPIMTVLEKELSQSLASEVKIKIKIASSYNKGIENIASGYVDFARLGPASYVLSQQINPALKIIAIEKNAKGKTASGVMAVRADSVISTIADLAGKSFAFGSENSTTGRYFAQFYLQESGIKSSALSEYAYLGRHDRVASSILAGQYDAGSFKIATFEKLQKQGNKFKVMVTYPILHKPWVAKANLETKIFNAIQAVLLEYDEPKLKPSAFRLSGEADFAFTKQTIEKNHLFWDTNL